MSRYQHRSSNPFESDETDFPNKNTFSSSQSPSSHLSSPGGATRSQPISSNSRLSSLSSYQNPQRSSLSSQSTAYSSSQYYEENSPFEDRHSQLQMKIANSENTQLESTQRALASIYESEAMGIATAEELLQQEETLKNIENKIDGMQQTMKVSQRHLNNIKSIFGGIKNWRSGKKKTTDNKSKRESANTRLQATITKAEKPKPEFGGFYDSDGNLDSQFMTGSRKPGGGQYTMITPITRTAREEEIDRNLGLMSDGISSLKALSLGLGDKLQSHNEQLDRINVKVDKADQLLTHQNTQIKRILKK